MDMQKQIKPNIKLYRRHIHIFWWANRWIHVKFIARELTSVCVAAWVLILLFYVRAIIRGQASYENFIALMRTPLMIAINVLLLGGLIFHSITWFNLAPKAMVVKVGEKPLPGIVIALMNYVGWIVISGALVWIMLQ
jgi:fumarate reductase subunit C